MLTTQIFSSYLNGATMMGCLVVSMIFLKTYRETKDRFFTMFSLAFLLFAVDRIALVISGGVDELNLAVYGIRCLGFILIICAVVDKNRPRPSSS